LVQIFIINKENRLWLFQDITVDWRRQNNIPDSDDGFEI
jgi:hypothetical protein